MAKVIVEYSSSEEQKEVRAAFATEGESTEATDAKIAEIALRALRAALARGGVSRSSGKDRRAEIIKRREARAAERDALIEKGKRAEQIFSGK